MRRRRRKWWWGAGPAGSTSAAADVAVVADAVAAEGGRWMRMGAAGWGWGLGQLGEAGGRPRSTAG